MNKTQIVLYAITGIVSLALFSVWGFFAYAGKTNPGEFITAVGVALTFIAHNVLQKATISSFNPTKKEESTTNEK